LAAKECLICRGREGDAELERVEVWEDRLWRLTVSLSAETLGFSYLEPKRHISYVTGLDGEEATTFGPVLQRVTSALREATGCQAVYIYVFGDDLPHFHVHLAPHVKGDALNDQFIRGPVVEEKMPSGFTRIVSKEYPALPAEELRVVAEKVRQRLKS